MNQRQLPDLAVFLKKQGYQIFAPQASADEERLLIETLEPEKISLESKLPFYSWKEFFVPPDEVLFNFSERPSILRNKSAATAQDGQGSPLKKIALLGVNLLDLKAVLLYDHVFEKDPYYQNRRQNILIIGHNLVPQIEENIFGEKYEEDVLEHLRFDIFLAQAGKDKFRVFSGSAKGQELLNNFGQVDFEHIEFAGPIKEEGPDSRMVQIRQGLKNNFNPKLWQELGARCLECGRCSFVCPTCFCFRQDDCLGLGQPVGTGPRVKARGRRDLFVETDCNLSLQEDASGLSITRQRCWDSCFFDDFSEIAGGYKFSDTAAKKIYFWYYHKFVRIPDQYSFMGCIGCDRCSHVCPVGINIAEVLQRIVAT